MSKGKTSKSRGQILRICFFALLVCLPLSTFSLLLDSDESGASARHDRPMTLSSAGESAWSDSAAAPDSSTSALKDKKVKRLSPSVPALKEPGGRFIGTGRSDERLRPIKVGTAFHNDARSTTGDFRTRPFRSLDSAGKAGVFDDLSVLDEAFAQSSAQVLGGNGFRYRNRPNPFEETGSPDLAEDPAPGSVPAGTDSGEEMPGDESGPTESGESGDVVPVEDAPAEQTDESISNTETPEEDQPANQEPDGAGDDTVDETPDDSSSGADTPKETTQSKFDFLVLGAPLAQDDTRMVFRAKRQEDNSFAVEDGSVLTIPAFSFREHVPSDPNQLIMTVDWDGDRQMDVVRAINFDDGSAGLFLQLRRPGLRAYPVVAESLFAGVKFRSAALFDSDRDGVPEVAALLAGRKELVYFRFEEDTFKLQPSSVALDFEPGLVMDLKLDHTGRVTTLLYVLDRELKGGIALWSEAPDRVLFDAEAPVFRPVLVNWANDPFAVDSEVLVYERDGRLVLARRDSEGASLLARFDVTLRVPDGLLGNYHVSGELVAFFWP